MTNGSRRIVHYKCVTIAIVLFVAVSAASQSPTPSPADSDSGFTVKSSIEVGVRFRSVSGSENKYRSDLNYSSGVRVFDSSFFIENNNDETWFDSALVTAGGWGADPTGYFRLNMEKTNAYRFDTSIRRVLYFNNLINHVNPNNTSSSLHNSNTTHNLSDLDLLLFPESNKLRVRLGYSANRDGGPADKTVGLEGYTVRAFSDEFGVKSDIDATGDGYRFGAEGTWFGVNMGVNYGHRTFTDRSRFFIDELNLGNNPTNTARLFTFNRQYMIEGDTDFVNYFFQKTFAERFDLSGRIIYAFSDLPFDIDENFTGRDNSNNFVDQDLFDIFGRSKRSQLRGDVGATFRITDDIRVSNTFTYDDFNISGDTFLTERPIRRNAAGNPISSTNDDQYNHRNTRYERFSNLIEADFQFGSRFAFNLGYRVTKRDVYIRGLDIDFNPSGSNPSQVPSLEEDENTTHSFIGGFKAKPHRNWSIYGDVEHGTADSIFTRLANNDFTNYRVRSQANFGNVAFNVSALTKRNDNPARSIVDPTRNVINEVTTRMFSTSLDWSPTQEFMLSGGYTYQYLTSLSDIEVPGVTPNIGVSEFYIRDSYYFIDVNAKFKRVAFFGSYRFSDDNGQGSRVTPPFTSSNIITSYPMSRHSPEFRFAIRLHRSVDWNIGYQYYNYKEFFPINPQNYKAHLPYTSLRFYFGRSADR